MLKVEETLAKSVATNTAKTTIENAKKKKNYFMSEIKGLENAFPIRLIYLDTKEEVHFRSVAHAKRTLRMDELTIKNSLNPIKKKRFEKDGRTFIFRPLKP